MRLLSPSLTPCCLTPKIRRQPPPSSIPSLACHSITRFRELDIHRTAP
jgi:hypothetical protein